MLSKRSLSFGMLPHVSSLSIYFFPKGEVAERTDMYLHALSGKSSRPIRLIFCLHRSIYSVHTKSPFGYEIFMVENVFLTHNLTQIEWIPSIFASEQHCMISNTSPERLNDMTSTDLVLAKSLIGFKSRWGQNRFCWFFQLFWLFCGLEMIPDQTKSMCVPLRRDWWTLSNNIVIFNNICCF